MKIETTGVQHFIEDDRPALYATFGAGNTNHEHLEVHLEWVDPVEDLNVRGWFKVSDLQMIISHATADARSRMEEEG